MSEARKRGWASSSAEDDFSLPKKAKNVRSQNLERSRSMERFKDGNGNRYQTTRPRSVSVPRNVHTAEGQIVRARKRGYKALKEDSLNQTWKKGKKSGCSKKQGLVKRSGSAERFEGNNKNAENEKMLTAFLETLKQKPCIKINDRDYEEKKRDENAGGSEIVLSLAPKETVEYNDLVCKSSSIETFKDGNGNPFELDKYRPNTKTTEMMINNTFLETKYQPWGNFDAKDNEKKDVQKEADGNVFLLSQTPKKKVYYNDLEDTVYSMKTIEDGNGNRSGPEGYHSIIAPKNSENAAMFANITLSETKNRMPWKQIDAGDMEEKEEEKKQTEKKEDVEMIEVEQENNDNGAVAALADACQIQ